MAMIYPWHTAIWQQVLAEPARLPHALLLAGPTGGGKTLFARSLAQRLLCEDVTPEGYACGVCDACRWFEANNHPDVRFVMPAADEAESAEEKPTEKAKSTQIRIEQIRNLAEFLSVGAVRGGRRVVVIGPAEAMNTATANALLKLLEEPPLNTQFILVSDEPRRLLPTVRSRCQVRSFPPPDRVAAQAWLKVEGVSEPHALLDFTGGMPLAARDLAAQAPNLARFVSDIESLPKADAIALAAQWDAWVKAKAGVQPMDLGVLSSWLQKWVFDLIAVKATGNPRFFSNHRERLRAVAETRSLASLFGCYNAIGKMRRVSTHPLNPRLFLDDMLLRYARMLAG